MRAHHGGERPVEIVGGHVHLVGVRHVRDLHRLPYSVPRRVDDGHVHGVVLEERTVVATSEQALQRGHGHGGVATDVVKGLGVPRVDLHPGEIEGLHGAGHPEKALCLVVEVQVYHDAHVGAGPFPEGGQLLLHGPDHEALRIQLGKALAGAGEAGGVVARVVPEDQRIGLERRVALLGDLLPQLHDVVERPHGRNLHLLVGPHAIRPAVRPVHADAVAHGAAQHLVHGNAEGAGLHVEHRVLDGGDGLLDEAARSLAPDGVHQGDVRLPGARILADHGGGELVDDRGEARAAEGLVVLGPADQTAVGGQLEEIEIARPGIAVQRLQPGDFHQGVTSGPRE